MEAEESVASAGAQPTGPTRTPPLRAQLVTIARSRGAWLTALVLLPCAYLLAQQVETLAFPILGEHRWRQSDVYSVAYNFAHEDPDFFRPRIDWTNGKSGIMAMEPPILPYLIAGALRVWGDDAAVARWVTWSLCMLGALGFALGLARERGTLLGALALLGLLLSPMGLFELRQVQPDASSALLAGAAALLFVRASRRARARDYLAALALYSLAVLLKGPAIVLAPAMPLFAVSARPVRLPALCLRALPMLLPALLLGAWYRWGEQLNATYSAKRQYFALAPKPGELLQNLSDTQGLWRVLGDLYPGYAINFWLLPAALLGLALELAALVCRREDERLRRGLALAFLVWLACTTAFLTAFASRLNSHWYYAVLVLPAVAYFTACGLRWPLSALVETAPRARWVRYALVLATVLVVPFAARHAVSILLYRSAAQQARGYRAQVLTPLRSAVARYTTRADLIATNGRDPSTLHDALRKGWSHSNSAIAKMRLAYFAKRGAVLYVHFGDGGSLPREILQHDSRYPLLHEGRGYRVYCLRRVCPVLPEKRSHRKTGNRETGVTI